MSRSHHPTTETTRRAILGTAALAAASAARPVSVEAEPFVHFFADAELFQLETEYRRLSESLKSISERNRAAHDAAEAAEPPPPAVIYATGRDREIGLPEPSDLAHPGCYTLGQFLCRQHWDQNPAAEARVNVIVPAIEAWNAECAAIWAASGYKEGAHNEAIEEICDFIAGLANVPAESMAGLLCKARMVNDYMAIFDDEIGEPEADVLVSIVRDLATGKQLQN